MFLVLSVGTLSRLSSPVLAQCEPQWGSGLGFLTVDGTIRAFASYDDGSGVALYAGGDFVTAGGVTANHIGRWNGTTWSALGSGIDGPVHALAVFDDGSGPALYAAGAFATAGGISARQIARWDGTSWSALGSGMEIGVVALAVFDDGSGPALYAGGYFGIAGGVSASRIAKWDGTTWSALGNGVDFSVRALAVFDDGSGPALYVGGGLVTAGGVSANHVARWNGASWSAVGSGVNSEVLALKVFNDGSGPALYAGAINDFVKWNGTSWSALGTTSAVFSLAVFDDGAGPALYWGRQDGKILSNSYGLATMNNAVLALADFDAGAGAALYAGGSFTYMGTSPVNRIARWKDGSWSSGLDSGVRAFATFGVGSGAALYAGGYFGSGIAQWDGANWSGFGGGFWESPWLSPPPSVHALAVFDDGSGPALYVGGHFDGAGAVTANGIAQWSGASWSSLGSGMAWEGMNGDVDALAVFDDGSGPALYAAGYFTTAGGVAASHIAKWDGASWSPLGSGVGEQYSQVYALAVFDDGSGPALYAGGGFVTAGGIDARHVAQWDGANWSALDSGTNGWVRALAVIDLGNGPALYAGGEFTVAGGVSANRIAKWDGTSWSPLGGGVGGARVSALAAFDDGSGPALYAGGGTTNTSGFVRKWDGASWSLLGSGMNDEVLSLATFDDGFGPGLHVGGTFTTVNGLAANRIAKWSIASLCGDAAGSKTRTLSFSVSPPAVASVSGTALRVTLVSLQHPVPPNAPCCPSPNFSAFESATCTASSEQAACARWAGPPQVFLESQDNPGMGSFRAARLQCAPYYHDWHSEGLIHVVGAEIVPSSTYLVEVLAAGCEGSEDTCTEVSAPVTLQTARWGDVVAPFQTPDASLTQPNALDVNALVNKFRNAPGAPFKAVAQLQPNVPDLNGSINALDVTAAVDSFRGFAFAFSGPCVCPSTVPCNTTACSGASACTGLYGAGATCVKTCTTGPNTGAPCNNHLHCGQCVGGANAGVPCDANGDCASNSCSTGICPTGTNPGFCRDRCGRCN
jgi:hypothetical protein